MPAIPRNRRGPASRFSLLYAVLRGGVAGFIAAWAVELLYIFIGPNVHVVAPGAVYRSAQLGPAELEHVVRRYQIRTVVNLCGCSDPAAVVSATRAAPPADWGFARKTWASPPAACRPSTPCASSSRRWTAATIPILIHCHRGIDRTGMASTVALLLHTDAGLAEAREQLGFRYCHLACGKYGNIDRFFDLYQEWLNGRPHSSQLFRQWVEPGILPRRVSRPRSSCWTQGRCTPRPVSRSASASAAPTRRSSRG